MTFLLPPPRTLVVAAVTLLALVAGAPAAPAQADPSSIRLVAASHRVTLYSHGNRVPLDLGVWVATSGGDFELRVARPDYDEPMTIAQVDPDTGAVVRSLPADVLDGWRGLGRFVRVTFWNDAGERVATRRVTFCPNGERQRVDDTGPAVSRYPFFCVSGSPFFKGNVWGIDDGWASSAIGGGHGEFDEGDPSEIPSVRVPEGRYTVAVRIVRRYSTLFAVPRVDRVVTLDVTVKPAPYEGEYRPRRDAARASAARVEGVPTVRNPDPNTLPDLSALPLWSLHVSNRRSGRSFLEFAATPWNAGPAPLVVEGFRRPGEDVMDAYQYFYDTEGNVVGRARVGTMKYDARRAHQHWHFLQFASFSLVDAGSNEVVRSRKQAFCLVPTDAIDLTAPGADFTPWGLGFGTVCGGARALWVREVLQVGWGDTYYQGGRQAFEITKVPNGWYYVRIQVNPRGRLYDRTSANDIETRLVYLRGRPGARTALAAPWHGINP